MIPKDPVMLLSFVNMKLRDFYPDLESLCMDLEVSVEDITDRLEQIQYRYDRAQNSFVAV